MGLLSEDLLRISGNSGKGLDELRSSGGSEQGQAYLQSEVIQLSDKCLADIESASPEKPGTRYEDLAEQVIPLGEMEINMEADLLRMSGKSNQGWLVEIFSASRF